jgi:hypothetical protein
MERQSFAEDAPVNTKDLAKAMGISRWTIGRYKKQGYQFEMGRLTTPGHFKAWLRERAASDPFHGPAQKRLQGVLDCLR